MGCPRQASRFADTLGIRIVEALMSNLLAIIAAAALAAPALHAAPAPRAAASDTPRAAFIKKCLRDMTKRSCTAPPEARASK
jgi:hypothetical protein